MIDSIIELNLVNLTLAHLRIGHMEGNPEVGNSEYMGHQDCPPQLVCFLVAQYSPWVSSEHVGSVFREHSNYCTPRRIYVQTEMNDESSLFKKKVNFDHCSSASNLASLSLFHYLFKLIISLFISETISQGTMLLWYFQRKVVWMLI